MNENTLSREELDRRIIEETQQWEQSLLESLLHRMDSYVDPAEAYRDHEGRFWNPIFRGGSGGESSPPGFTEHFLMEIRNQSRDLVFRNEFAINALENRINYIVGSGHRYYAIPTSQEDVELSKTVRERIDSFVDKNQWDNRHREIVRRKDRDGEVFLRFFKDFKGNFNVRFVEPAQISTPQKFTTSPEHSLGIHTHAEDVENVLGYWVDGNYVPSQEIQHRKANVDSSVKRGIPLFHPVQKNFRRIEKLQRNMSIVAEIQSAIALVRKHSGSTSETLRRFVQTQSEGTVQDPLSGQSRSIQRFHPGTIIDAYNGTDYEFPVVKVDASRFILILQAELRAIASRLVIPEFMLTSDASNANYSSTMIAEGPAVRMFERLQHETICEDLCIMRRVVQHGIDCGILPGDTFRRITLHAIPPMLAVRDRLKEARADEILLNCGVLSPHTMSMRYGLDPGKESKLRTHCRAECNCADDPNEDSPAKNGT